MIKDEQIQVGKWVYTLREWPEVALHSAGRIVEDYGTGIKVEWWTDGWRGEVFIPNNIPMRDPARIRDGFDKERELGFLAPLPTEWVPYLMTLNGNRIAKIDMKGHKLPLKTDAISWVQQGQGKTHPELNGRRIDCVEEPVWPQEPERILTA